MKGAQVLHTADRMRLMLAGDERGLRSQHVGMEKNSTWRHSSTYTEPPCNRLCLPHLLCALWISVGGKSYKGCLYLLNKGH